LAIDSTDPVVVERALRVYPGRALLNSISGEKERIEKMLPLAAEIRAMFILLPLTDEGIPANCG
jgi:5-methyltetrahydrofolate--homocysteine methyltransferase